MDTFQSTKNLAAMPDLMDRLYCSEQIHIPPTFPFIMKLYCKAAIRTQPYDLLKWSAAYFRALANGEEPPVKERIEYPPYDSPTGLTPGYIKMLIKQLGKNPNTTVSVQTLFVKWNCVSLEDELLIKIIALLGAKTNPNWLKFVAVACGFICTTLTNTMILICELLTDEPEGGMASIPLDVFNELYSYLAAMNCGPITEDELKTLENIEVEEDASAVAEKIREAIYVAEEEGEGGLFAVEDLAEAEEEEEAHGEFEIAVEAKKSQTDSDMLEKPPVLELPLVGEDEGEGRDLSSPPSKENIYETDSKESIKEDDDIRQELVDDASRLETGTVSHESSSADNEEVIRKEKLADIAEKTVFVKAADEEGANKRQKEGVEKREKAARKIKLGDIEESIRVKIEKKLAEDETSGKSDSEFEGLNSYLLDAAIRAKKYSEEEIGHRIFKKYARQEVPGIGPTIDQAEVEKVLDFMDFNSHKQEGMVMPRNIRHWMCPPLDKVPVPEP